VRCTGSSDRSEPGSRLTRPPTARVLGLAWQPSPNHRLRQHHDHTANRDSITTIPQTATASRPYRKPRQHHDHTANRDSNATHHNHTANRDSITTIPQTATATRPYRKPRQHHDHTADRDSNATIASAATRSPRPQPHSNRNRDRRPQPHSNRDRRPQPHSNRHRTSVLPTLGLLSAPPAVLPRARLSRARRQHRNSLIGISTHVTRTSRVGRLGQRTSPA
jgi:hypothetical protein